MNTNSQGGGANGPTLIDHNQIMNHQFNTTTGQITSQIKIQQQPNSQQPQIGGNHVRAGT